MSKGQGKSCLLHVFCWRMTTSSSYLQILPFKKIKCLGHLWLDCDRILKFNTQVKTVMTCNNAFNGIEWGMWRKNSVHLWLPSLYNTYAKISLTSTELMLFLVPEVLAIQWPYPFSGPSTLISAKCCWRAVERPLKTFRITLDLVCWWKYCIYPRLISSNFFPSIQYNR